MYYKITVCKEGNETMIYIYYCDLLNEPKIVNGEMVFGISPYSELLFYISQHLDNNVNIYECISSYTKKFMILNNAVRFYTILLEYIAKSPCIEIL